MDLQSAKIEYCKLVDRLAPGWRPVEKSAVSGCSEAEEESDAKLDAMKNVKVMSLDALVEAAKQVQVEPVSCGVVAVLAIFAYRAIIKQKSVLRAAAFSFLAACLARQRRRGAVSLLGFEIEIRGGVLVYSRSVFKVDSKGLRATLMNERADVVPSGVDIPASGEPPKTNQLV